MSISTKVLLLDLGGVLLELKDPVTTFSLDIDLESFKQRWLLSPAVQQLERGNISMADFSAAIIKELELKYDADEFLRRFNQWPGQLFPGTIELLQRLKQDYRLALLSNINPSHWQLDGIAERLTPIIEHCFLSYEIGAVKPDREAFLAVCQELNCQFADILFFDDNEINVAAARDLGIDARITEGLSGIRALLENT